MKLDLKNKKDWGLYTTTIKYNKPNFKLLEGDISDPFFIFKKHVWSHDNLTLAHRKNKFVEDWEYILLECYGKFKTSSKRTSTVKWKKISYKEGDLINIGNKSAITGDGWKYGSGRTLYISENNFFTEKYQYNNWRTKSIFPYMRIKQISWNFVVMEAYSKNQDNNSINQVSIHLKLENDSIKLKIY